MAVDWHAVSNALLHPIVVDVLERCDGRSRSPKQLAEVLEMPLGRVSYHVRQLADAGLLVLVDEQPRRGALEHYYRLAPSVQRRRNISARPAPQANRQDAASHA
jgi:DNA-binding transcriptional ArsR family regulator